MFTLSYAKYEDKSLWTGNSDFLHVKIWKSCNCLQKPFRRGIFLPTRSLLPLLRRSGLDFLSYIKHLPTPKTRLRTEQNRPAGRDLQRLSPTDHPLHPSSNQKLRHVIEGTAQMPVEHWQALGINHVSRKPVPGFDPNVQMVWPNVQPEPLL